VTFLFVIMLAQQEGVSNADQRSREPFLASLAGCVLLASLLCVLHKTYYAPDPDGLRPKLRQLSEATDPAEVKRVLGERVDTKERDDLITKLLKQHGEENENIAAEINNLDHRWSGMRTNPGQAFRPAQGEGKVGISND